MLSVLDHANQPGLGSPRLPAVAARDEQRSIARHAAKPACRPDHNQRFEQR
jgi:hypothetical protein